MNIKNQIEQLYIFANFNDEAPSSFANKILDLFGESDKKLSRSIRQSNSRWKYLTMVASILNDRGFTYDAIGLEIPLKWNKDILYHVYWQSSRDVMYPGKRKQLKTGEFCKLADHVMDLFSVIFDIHIPFPNMKDYLRELDDKNNK